VLLASFTFVTDLLVCFTLWNRPTVNLVRGGHANRIEYHPKSNNPQVLLVLVRAVLKAAVVITSMQLRLLLPRLRRHAVSANSTTQVHTDGRVLFACGTALILLACLSSIGLLLQVPEMIDDTGYTVCVVASLRNRSCFCHHVLTSFVRMRCYSLRGQWVLCCERCKT
jgi:hypothetical protein